jgi:hypothetical protein
MKRNRDLDLRLEGYSRSASALRAVRRGLSGRGVRYSAAAAAGAALMGAGSAEAALISSPIQGLSASTFSGLTFGSLDVDGDGNADLSFFMSGWMSLYSGFLSSDSNGRPFSSPGSGSLSNAFFLYGRLQQAAASVVFNPEGLSSTTLCECRSLFTTFPAYNPPPSFTSWSTRTRTFAFAFTAGTNTSSAPNAGWMRAILQFGPGATRVSFPDIAYNTTPGASLHVGAAPAAVPEPSSVALMGLGLLALGSRGVREMRRRKKSS